MLSYMGYIGLIERDKNGLKCTVERDGKARAYIVGEDMIDIFYHFKYYARFDYSDGAEAEMLYRLNKRAYYSGRPMVLRCPICGKGPHMRERGISCDCGYIRYRDDKDIF